MNWPGTQSVHSGTSGHTLTLGHLETIFFEHIATATRGYERRSGTQKDDVAATNANPREYLEEQVGNLAQRPILNTDCPKANALPPPGYRECSGR